MMSDRKEECLKQVISRSLLNDLDQKEQMLLDEWLRESETNRIMYDRLRNQKDIMTKYEAFVDFEKHKPGLTVRPPASSQAGLRKLLIGLTATSAAVLVLGLWLLLPRENALSGDALMTQEILTKQTGTDNRAVLTLSDGQNIAVEGNTGQIRDVAGVIRNDGARLVYSDKETTAAIPAAADHESRNYNTLSVPAGSTFAVKLADGTQVTLNSCSKLRYPVKFSASAREVWLDGEGYFDVAKNPEAIFTVHCPAHDVVVTGTQFNVSAYRDEAGVTALLSGSVMLSSGDGRVNLLPGMIAISDGEKITMVRGDVDMHTSWLDDRFAFDREPLDNLLRKFERWYGIHFEVSDPAAISGKSFSGYIPRYRHISDLLEVLEVSAGLRFNSSDTTVTVMQAR